MNFDRIVQNYVQDAYINNKSNKSCHVALLLNGNKVISYGFNQMDRQCFRGKSIHSLHAEIDCLRKCRPIKNTKKYTLVIVKVSKNPEINNKKYHESSPCNCCTKFIKGLGFKSIYCTTNDGLIKKINLSEYIPYT